METLRVGPHDAVPVAQHPQKQELFKWKKSMDDFFHGQIELTLAPHELAAVRILHFKTVNSNGLGVVDAPCR